MPILFLALYILSFSLHASVPVDGHFFAKQNCPAYLSKNKQTNPGHLSLDTNQYYRIRAINSNAPDWFQIELPGQTKNLRWVNKACGSFDYRLLSDDPCVLEPGKADSNVLALSHHLAFCETYGYGAGKPECHHLKQDAHQAHHLVLHGLWPNQKSCGIKYGFCGTAAKKRHCDYEPLALSTPVSETLKIAMPSYAYGSCLERHEWNKHGRCQLLPLDDYFMLATRLLKQVNESRFANYIDEHGGEKVLRSDLMNLLQEEFGDKAAERVYLACKNGILVDIYFYLPALIPVDANLKGLLNSEYENRSKQSCPKKIKISNFRSAEAVS